MREFLQAGCTCRHPTNSVKAFMDELSILAAIFPNGSGLAAIRTSPFWIMLEQRMMEVVVTSGVVRHAKKQSDRHHWQTSIQFTNSVLSTEGKRLRMNVKLKSVCGIAGRNLTCSGVGWVRRAAAVSRRCLSAATSAQSRYPTTVSVPSAGLQADPPASPVLHLRLPSSG